MRLASLNIDLDEVPCYAAIHGLQDAMDTHAESANAIYDSCVSRAQDFFESYDAKGTFFVVGKDAHRKENAALLKRLGDRGHELGNHTLNHRYEFSRLPTEEVRTEIVLGRAAIERASGTRVLGFRAPGYVINDGVFEILQEENFFYDSSVFPCPAYYAAKNAAIALIRLRGRESKSLVDDPRVLTAPADPYRIGKPYWTSNKSSDGLLEIPMGVTRGTRLPFIGTSIALANETIVRALTHSMIGRPFVNIELHGIDFADAKRDGLEWLAPHQPDLKRSGEHKLRMLSIAVEILKKAGYRFVTLNEAAAHFR